MRDEKAVFAVLLEMQRRKSANPLDKVRRLAYIIGVQWLPAYDMAQSAEQAWGLLGLRCTRRTQAEFVLLLP